MRIFRAFPAQPMTEGVDTGSGGGGAAGASAAAGAGGTQPGAGGTGGGAAAPVALDDTTPITVDGKTTTYGEYRKNFVSRSDFEGEQKKFSDFQNNLRALAAKIKNNPNPNAAGNGQQPRVDPFANFRGQPIVSGDDLAKLAEQGFGQLAQRIDQQQKMVTGVMQKLQALEKGVGGVHERNAQGDFSKRVDSVITSLGEGFDPKNETLRSLAEDVYYSYDWKGNEAETEYPKIFKTRVDGFLKLARSMDQAKLKAAKEKRFVRPGGNAQPGGAGKQRMTNTQIADMVFPDATAT